MDNRAPMSATALAASVAAYFLLLLAVAWRTSRGADNQSFFIGNRSSHWGLVAFGMIGTSLSGVTFISVPGAVGTTSWHYLQIVLGQFIGYAVIAFVLLPLYYRLQVTSIYDTLRQRLGMTSYRTGAAFFILSRTLGATARLYLVVRILQDIALGSLGMPFWLTTLIILVMIVLYTYEGGVKTIVWTDTLQTAGMLIGLVACIVFVLSRLQLSPGEAFDAMRGANLATVFNTDADSRQFWLKQIVAGMFIAVAMTGLDQEMMQKNISVRTLADAQKNMMVLSVIMVGVVLLFLFLGDLRASIVVALTLPLIPIFMALVGWTTEARTRKRWLVQTRLAGHFADLVAGLPTLQVFGRARAQAEGLRRSEDAHRGETMGTLRISFLSALVLELLSTLSVAIVAVGIGFRVVFDQVDLTTAFFVLILAPEVYLPVRQVGVHYHDAADGMAAAESAFAIIESAPTTPPRTASAPVPNAPRLSVDALSHTYPGAQAPALAPVGFDLHPGELLVVTGPSGCGKTTLLNALMGFIAPTAGRVLVDGAALDAASRRERIAWVGQTPGMISGTIADNVRLGDPDADDAAVRPPVEYSSQKPVRSEQNNSSWPRHSGWTADSSGPPATVRTSSTTASDVDTLSRPTRTRQASQGMSGCRHSIHARRPSRLNSGVA